MLKSNTTELGYILAALGFTLIAMATTEPALNTGDYARVLNSMSLEVGVWKQPGHCLAYVSSPAEWPTSSAAFFGMIFGFVDRAIGSNCLSIDHWFLILSMIYWIGGLLVLRRGKGLIKGISAFLLFASYFLFAGFLYSFYQEAVLLPLTPWLYLGFAARNPSTIPFVLLIGFALLSKPQAVFFAPVFFFLVIALHRRAPSWTRTSLGLAMIFATSAFSLANTCCGEQNAYNRIFNGIGWTILKAEDWPAPEFDQRHSYFYENQSELTSQAGPACAPNQLKLMGTTYWPTGNDIRTSSDTSEPAIENAEFVKNLNFWDFLSCFASETSASDYLNTTFSQFFGSDFSVPYIFKYSGRGGLLETINQFRKLILNHLPILLAIAVVVAILLRARAWAAILLIYLFLAAPLFVALGDGFFEFEKHILLHFLFLICPGFLFLLLPFEKSEPEPHPE
ncbi:MAG: hypothetical protein GY945_12225 [Rhodobacteraceae bacterium]|nr:hypothetical protein [Paracoccaceae bacterium]